MAIYDDLPHLWYTESEFSARGSILRQIHVPARRSGSGHMMVSSQRMTWRRTLTTEQSPNGQTAASSVQIAYCIVASSFVGSYSFPLLVVGCGCKLITPNPNPKLTAAHLS